MARKSRKNVVVVESPKRSAMKVWRAALYVRLSVEFNSKKGDSLETQQQIMEAYIALRPDIEIAEVYTDNGVSGRTFEREAFQRMLSDVEAGKINCIVVKDLSRLGRNTIDTGYYDERRMKNLPGHSESCKPDLNRSLAHLLQASYIRSFPSPTPGAYWCWRHRQGPPAP